MDEKEFLQSYISNAPHIMWFLGAGSSRTAGMPTATDIIWDLKLKYYCLQENQDIKKHDINNDVIKKRVQAYMDSKGFPELWSTEEYSFYFDLFFKEDRAAQQKYITEQLSDKKISLNIGHRCLAALVAMDITKLIFTTNFDNVIEKAFAEVAESNLTAFHLEGSYAALEALNSGQFPIYAKIHGDVRYQSIKNISADLIDNDTKIKDCFLAGCSRYGLVVSGYSGRDQNVMTMFYEAIAQHNAFPAGLFWTVTNKATVAKSVTEFIEAARAKGIKACIVETGTFDIMLSKIWRQLPKRTESIDAKVRTAAKKAVNIPFSEAGRSYPIVRTNALPIIEVPKSCAVIDPLVTISHDDFKELMRTNKPKASMIKADAIYGFGGLAELTKGIGQTKIKTITKRIFDNPFQVVSNDFAMRSFYERALVMALCTGKALKLVNEKGFYITVDPKKLSDPIYLPLKQALQENGQGNIICGQIPGKSDIFWSEAVSVKLEEKNGLLFLMLKPEIMIDPAIEKRNFVDFIKAKRLKRYNKTTSAILDAWIKILFGSVGAGESATISYLEDSEYPANFVINTRTVFSRKAG